MDNDNYKFDTRWLKDIPAEEVDAFKAQLISDKNTLDKLCKIVYNIVRNDGDIKSSDYDIPSWSHKQAHLNGRKEAFETVIALCWLDKSNRDYEQA